MRVRSIKRVKPRPVFAVETSTGTFIADGLAHHNCAGCNLWASGNQTKYEAFMVEHYGHEEMDRIVLQANTPYTYTIDELVEIEARYKAMADEIEKGVTNGTVD